MHISNVNSTWLTSFSNSRTNSIAVSGELHSCTAGRLILLKTTKPPRLF